MRAFILFGSAWVLAVVGSSIKFPCAQYLFFSSESFYFEKRLHNQFRAVIFPTKKKLYIEYHLIDSQCRKEVKKENRRRQRGRKTFFPLFWHVFFSFNLILESVFFLLISHLKNLCFLPNFRCCFLFGLSLSLFLSLFFVINFMFF